MPQILILFQIIEQLVIKKENLKERLFGVIFSKKIFSLKIKFFLIKRY